MSITDFSVVEHPDRRLGVRPDRVGPRDLATAATPAAECAATVTSVVPTMGYDRTNAHDCDRRSGYPDASTGRRKYVR